MLNGGWEACKEVYKLMPGFIRKPTGFGKYKVADHGAYFYLSEFVEMDLTTIPTPERFTVKLTALHQDS